MGALPFTKNQKLQERVTIQVAFPGADFTAAAASAGGVTCDTNANMADHDLVTVGDGLTPAKTYEYDKAADGVPSVAGRIIWTAGTTAATVAANLRTAILANQPGLNVVDNADGTLTITHKWPGAGGNVAMTKSSASALAVTGLTGGAALTENTSADTTRSFFDCYGDFQIDKAEVLLPAGLVADAANYFIIQVLDGANVMAQYSTQVGQEGTIAADTWKAMTLGAGDLKRALAGHKLQYFLDVHGTQNLPPGRLQITGRYRNTPTP